MPVHSPYGPDGVIWVRWVVTTGSVVIPTLILIVSLPVVFLVSILVELESTIAPPMSPGSF
jgi:hypothetical protein